MKSKTLIALLVLLVACIAWITTSSLLDSAPEASYEQGKTLIFGKAFEEISRLRVSTPDGRAVTFARTDGQWRIVSPVQAEADSFKVNRIVRKLKGLEYERMAGPGDFDYTGPNVTGLDAPTWTLTFTDGEGAEHTLKIGNPAPAPPTGRTYVQPAGDDRTYVAAVDFDDLLSGTVSTYRDMTVLDVEKDRVTRLEVRGGGDLRYTLRRDGEEWLLVDPVSAETNSDPTGDLLDAVSRIKAEEFVTEDPNELPAYQLDEPPLVVRMEIEETVPPAGTRPATAPETRTVTRGVAFGRVSRGKVYAKRLDSPSVFAVGESVLEKIVPLPEVRSNDVMRFETGEVTGIDLELPDGEAKLVRRDGTWHMTAPQAGLAGEKAVEDLLEAMSGLKASQFRDDPVSLATYGLDEPNARLTVHLGEQGRSLTLLVGQRRPLAGVRLVKPASRDWAAAVPDEAAAPLLNAPAAYWDPTLLELPAAGEVTAMRIERLERTWQAHRDPNGNWRINAPVEAPAETANVRKVLEALSPLTAERVVALAEEVPQTYAKTIPKITVELTVAMPVPATAAATQPASTRPARSMKKIVVHAVLDEAEGQVYAWRADQRLKAVGQLKTDFFDTLLAELRSLEVTDFDPDAVRKIELTPSGGEQTVELTRSDEGAWDHPAEFVEIDDDKVTEYLQAVAKVKASRFADHSEDYDPEKYGLVEPAAALALTLADGRTWRLAISAVGAEKGKYAACSEVPGVFVLAPGDVRKIDKTLEAFKE